MKIPHKSHGFASDRTDPLWAERVEREAERITDQAEARHAKVAERAAQIERRIIKESTRNRPDRKLLRRLEEALEARRTELLTLHRQMNTTPAGSQNRGNPAHRGVARGEVI